MRGGATVREPRRSRIPPKYLDPEPRIMTRRGPPKMEIPQQDLHEHLWSQTDERGRVDLDIGTVALEYGVSYPIAHRVVKLIRSEGRIKLVAWKRDRQTVYQVANPDTFDLDRPETHAQERVAPIWG